MINPYTPPRVDFADDRSTKTNRLLYIWIWLPTAIVGAMAATPADPFSMLAAMAFALPCFLIGVAAGSSLSSLVRWTLMAGCILIAGAIAATVWSNTTPSFLLIAIFFAVVNVTLGYKSVVSVVRNRRRVFAALAICYSVGLVLSPLGILLLTVPAVLIASRKTEDPTD